MYREAECYALCFVVFQSASSPVTKLHDSLSLLAHVSCYSCFHPSMIPATLAAFDLVRYALSQYKPWLLYSIHTFQVKSTGGA